MNRRVVAVLVLILGFAGALVILSQNTGELGECGSPLDHLDYSIGMRSATTQDDVDCVNKLQAHGLAAIAIGGGSALAALILFVGGANATQASGLSPDRRYWWNGSQWREVASSPSVGVPTSPAKAEKNHLLPTAVQNEVIAGKGSLESNLP